MHVFLLSQYLVNLSAGENETRAQANTSNAMYYSKCPAPQAGQLQKETLYLETKTTSQSNDFSLHPFSQIRFVFFQLVTCLIHREEVTCIYFQLKINNKADLT